MKADKFRKLGYVFASNRGPMPNITFDFVFRNKSASNKFKRTWADIWKGVDNPDVDLEAQQLRILKEFDQLLRNLPGQAVPHSSPATTSNTSTKRNTPKMSKNAKIQQHQKQQHGDMELKTNAKPPGKNRGKRKTANVEEHVDVEERKEIENGPHSQKKSTLKQKKIAKDMSGTNPTTKLGLLGDLQCIVACHAREPFL